MPRAGGILATQIAAGRLRIFSARELTLDALLASACIPSLHHSVEIHGEAHWDGGLTANPPLRRLNLHSIDSQDFMSRLSVMSKLNTHAAFIEALRDEGRSRTDDWLKENFRLIGARSSFPLSEHLLY